MESSVESRVPSLTVVILLACVLTLAGYVYSLRTQLVRAETSNAWVHDSLRAVVRSKDDRVAHLKRAVRAMEFSGALVSGLNVVSGDQLTLSDTSSATVLIISPNCSFSPSALPAARKSHALGRSVLVVSVDGDSARMFDYAKAHSLLMPVLVAPRGAIVEAFGREFTPVILEVQRGKLKSVQLGIEGAN